MYQEAPGALAFSGVSDTATVGEHGAATRTGSSCL